MQTKHVKWPSDITWDHHKTAAVSRFHGEYPSQQSELYNINGVTVHKIMLLYRNSEIIDLIKHWFRTNKLSNIFFPTCPSFYILLYFTTMYIAVFMFTYMTFSFFLFVYYMYYSWTNTSRRNNSISHRPEKNEYFLLFCQPWLSW